MLYILSDAKIDTDIIVKQIIRHRILAIFGDIDFRDYMLSLLRDIEKRVQQITLLVIEMVCQQLFGEH